MTTPGKTDRTKLEELRPNLQLGQPADPALRLAAYEALFDQIDANWDAFVSTLEGESGAELLGSAGIDDLTGDTIYVLLKDLRDKLRGLNGADFVNTSTGDSIQFALEALASAIETHKSSGDHDGRYNTIAELQSAETGTSGTRRISGEAISGIPAGTLYSQLVALKVAIDEAVTGAIPDGSITDVKLSDSAGQIKERVGSLQGEVVAHLAESMPHQFIDPVTSKVYRYGIAMQDGNLGVL